MKVCLVGSSGGHLTHLYMLKPFWENNISIGGQKIITSNGGFDFEFLKIPVFVNYDRNLRMLYGNDYRDQCG